MRIAPAVNPPFFAEDDPLLAAESALFTVGARIYRSERPMRQET